MLFQEFDNAITDFLMLGVGEVSEQFFDDGAVVLGELNCAEHIVVGNFVIAPVFESRKNQSVFQDENLHPLHATFDEDVVDFLEVFGEFVVPPVTEFVSLVCELEALPLNIVVPDFVYLADTICPECGVRHLVEEDWRLFLADVPLYSVGEPRCDEVLCQ